MPARKAPHDRVAVAALLAGVDIVEVISPYLPLKRSGAEWEACCPFHTEETPSFKVSPAKQIYHCFGCGANGDAIKFLQAHAGLTFLQAVEALGGRAPTDGRPDRVDPVAAAGGPTKPRRAPSPWHPILPVPTDAPEPPRAHVVRGLPDRTWCYRGGDGRRLGYVYRFTTSTGGKEILPVTWCERNDTGDMAWRWISFPEPRPLYGLDRLASRPDATVLLVEGEKCADVGAEQLPELVVISWPGGGKAIDKVDWSPLAGRKVVLWPDCDAKRVPLSRALRGEGGSEEERIRAQAAQPLLDESKQPGTMAMSAAARHLRGVGARLWGVRIPAPGERPDGWDIADAVRDGLTGDALRDWMRERTAPLENAPVQPSPSFSRSPASVESDGEPIVTGEDPAAWRRGLLLRDGRLIDCRENVYLIVRHHPAWDGVLWADEFSRKIVKRQPAPWDKPGFVAPAVWGEDDDLRLGLWLAQQLRMLVRSADTIASAVGWASREQKFHPVRDYLESLEWDGTPRIDHWTSDYLGLRRSEYASVSGRYTLIGMVSRIYQPGGILRSMPILEGAQYRGKSTALKILGSPWFSDTALDLSNKDAYQLIQGIWAYEISEMDTFSRTESSRMKGFISSPSDRFRAPYGREPADWPRQTAFFGTINPHGEYFKDPTGNTRYWPWACEQAEPIALEALAEQRDQLFAEAVALYKRGERWHPTAEQQRTLFDPEQESRTIEDAWDVLIDRWLRQITQHRVTVTDILLECLKLERGKITKQHTTTVGQAMAKIGWMKGRDSSGARERYYARPKGWGEEPGVKATEGHRQEGMGHGAV